MLILASSFSQVSHPEEKEPSKKGLKPTVPVPPPSAERVPPPAGSLWSCLCWRIQSDLIFCPSVVSILLSLLFCLPFMTLQSCFSQVSVVEKKKPSAPAPPALSEKISPPAGSLCVCWHFQSVLVVVILFFILFVCLLCPPGVSWLLTFFSLEYLIKVPSVEERKPSVPPSAALVETAPPPAGSLFYN